MMEPDAAPAGGRRTLLLLPGGAGAPPGGTTTPCEELADGVVGRPSGMKARQADEANWRRQTERQVKN